MAIDLNQPQITAAIVGGLAAIIVSVAVAIINQFFVRSMHRQRIAADHALAERKIAADIDLAEHKFSYDRELAERKFAYDQEFNDHKRRVELAEQVLTGFFQMRDIIREIRSPVSFGDEGEDRPKWQGGIETEAQAKSRRGFFVPASRLLKHGDFINGLYAKRHQMNAFFGSRAVIPFDKRWGVLAQIQAAVRGLMGSMAPDGRAEADPDLWQKWKAAIWADYGEPDLLAAEIDEAIAAVEAICRPVLTGKKI